MSKRKKTEQERYLQRAAQEYLSQVKILDVHISNKFEELERLEDLAKKVTSSWKQDAVSCGGTSDKVGGTVPKIADLKKEIETTIENYLNIKRKIERTISGVKNPNQLDILQKYYILHKSLEQIACELGYTYRNTCYLHEQALLAVAAVIESENIQT